MARRYDRLALYVSLYVDGYSPTSEAYEQVEDSVKSGGILPTVSKLMRGVFEPLCRCAVAPLHKPGVLTLCLRRPCDDVII